MSDLVYYYVPKEYMNVMPHWQQIYGFNYEDWLEIHIMDSNAIYENKSWPWSITTFADKPEEVALLLWDLKNPGETLSIRKRIRRFKKEYRTEIIASEQELVASLYEREVRFRDYSAIYTVDEVIRKVMFLSPGQEEFLFVKSQYAEDVENVIKKWADKSRFEVYEQGEDE